MIEALTGFPDHVAAFLCSGRVTRREYDTILIPTVMKALESYPKLRLYYETTPDFTIDPGALWEDFRFGMEHLTRWERFAVVTDVEWIRHALSAFGFLLPGRLEVFERSQADKARKWIIAGNPDA